MATMVPTGACSAGYHSKLIGIVPAAGSARSNGTRSFPHQAPSASSQGSRGSRPTTSRPSSSCAAAGPGGSPTAVIAASSRAGTNQDRRWRIGDHGQILNEGSILQWPSRQGGRSWDGPGAGRPVVVQAGPRLVEPGDGHRRWCGPVPGGSGQVAGDAAVPAAGPAKLVAFAGLQVELDLEDVGVAAQVQPDAGGHGRLRPLDPVLGQAAGPGRPGPVQRRPHRPPVALDQHGPVRQLGPAAMVDLGLGPAPSTSRTTGCGTLQRLSAVRELVLPFEELVDLAAGLGQLLLLTLVQFPVTDLHRIPPLVGTVAPARVGNDRPAESVDTWRTSPGATRRGRGGRGSRGQRRRRSGSGRGPGGW